MESKEKKNSPMKLWPLWLILIAIIAIVLVNKSKNGSEVGQLTNQTEGKTELSGKALSLVAPDQYFLPNWFGKKSPDFSVTTINGDTITLSSLTGKQVMFVFWATWCPPCRREIPHIIELRNEIGNDKLEIIGFSSENIDTVKNFVSKSEINYNIAVGSPQKLPEPFNRVAALPTIFFIDSEGKFKLAVEGGVSLEQMRGIIDAQ